MVGKSTDGLVSHYINRRFSNPITNFIVKHNLPFTPNQFSVISFSVGILGALMFILKYPIIAGILIQASSILDGVDGELARARNMQSKFGGFFDAILDRVVDIAAITSLSIYVILTTSPSNILIVSIIMILAATGAVMVSYIHARGEASLKIHPRHIGRFPSIASRDARLFIIFLGALFSIFFEQALFVTLILIAMLSYVYVFAKFAEIIYHHYRNPNARI